MRFISKFQNFEINEAFLDDSKNGISYTLSRQGRNSASKFGITKDLTLSFSKTQPSLNQEILWIKAASIQKISFGELCDILNISGSLVDKIMIYQTSSKIFPWAIAKKGIRTTMVKQLEKVGASKRGNHFRETAFIITLAIEAYAEKRIKIPIASNRGFIKMTYNTDGTSHISDDERGMFRNEYEMFMMSNPKAISAMIDQCRKLIKYLGNNIKNISYIIKNTTDLLINQAAMIYLKDESSALGQEEFAKIPFDNDEDSSDYNILDLPNKLSIAKWNPSDIWIVFDDGKWTMSNFDKYEELGDKKENEYENTSNIDDLNSFLMESILRVKGLIGVSLKQGSNEGKLSIVNSDLIGATHRYDGYKIESNKKTVVINFSYKFGNKKSFMEGSTIECRTFDTSNTSNVSLEVKGSKNAKHMSGKGGSLLESIMNPKYFKIKEFIRKSTDKQDISNYLKKERFKFSISRNNQDLQSIFEDDLTTGTIKTPYQNSRMQSIIIIEWLESLTQQEASKVITKIVKFAKSESSWSAPHLLAK